MIAISMLIVGCFLLLSENLGRAAELAQGKSRVDVYLSVNATQPQIAAVDRWLASHPDLARRRFVSREEALRRFVSYFANLQGIVTQLDGNPFPASFEIDVAPNTMQSTAFLREAKALRGITGVDDVQFDWEWVRRLKRVVNVVNIAGIVAGVVLALAAAFTIANVIRLTMMLYREEIDIMRLVGATERIIRGPFLVEGFLQGAMGALLAVALLFISFVIARRTIAPANSLAFSFLFNGFLPWQKLGAIVLCGMFAGTFGSWMSVRESGEEAA